MSGYEIKIIKKSDFTPEMRKRAENDDIEQLAVEREASSGLAVWLLNNFLIME